MRVILFLVAVSLMVVLLLLPDKGKETEADEQKGRPESLKVENNQSDSHLIVGETKQLISKIRLSKKEASLERDNRERLLAEYPDHYFDPARFLESNDKEYLKKVEHHFNVATWTYSTRKNDPALRQFMTLLLENGFGIDDYRKAIQVVADYKQEIAGIRKQYESLGFYSETEIDDLLEQRGAYDRLKAHIKGTRPIFERMGITDTELIENLWSVDIGFIAKGDGTIVDGRIQTVWGDRLLTDDDWLDEEFREARSRYKGKPRGSMKERFEAWELQRRNNLVMP